MSDEKAVWQVLDHEQHFNNIQAGIRGLASAWILAACAGASKVLIASDPKTGALLPISAVAIDADLLLVLILAALFGGLLLLWILDQLVYHRLLLSTFVAGLRLELLDADLQPIHWIMCVSDKGRTVPSRLRLFYFCPMLASFLLSIVLSAWISSQSTFSIAFLLCWGIVLLELAGLAWMDRTKQEATLERFAAELRGLGSGASAVGLPDSLATCRGVEGLTAGDVILNRLGFGSTGTSGVPSRGAVPDVEAEISG